MRIRSTFGYIIHAQKTQLDLKPLANRTVVGLRLSLFLMLIMLWVCVPLLSLAQAPPIYWQSSLGGFWGDVPAGVTASPDGGYVVAGNSSSNDGDVTGNHGSQDYWVVKLDAAGRLVWQKSLGGSGYDVAAAVTTSPDGGYVVVGYTSSNDGDVSGNHGSNDFWVVKLDEAGTLLWQKSFGGTDIDMASAVTTSPDGGYVVTGTTRSNDGDVSGNHGTNDIWVVKLDAAGTLVWQKTLGGSSTEYGNAITRNPDGGYVVAGQTYSSDGDVTGSHPSGDFWVVKIDEAGTLLWQKSFGGTGTDVARSVTSSPDAGFAMAGYTNSVNGDVTGYHGSWDYWVVKIDSVGNLLWQKALGGSYSDIPNSITASPDGSYVVAGESSSDEGDLRGDRIEGDFWIVKLNSAGGLVWQLPLGGPGIDAASAVIASPDGGYVVAGSIGANDVYPTKGAHDFLVVKLGKQSPTISNLVASPNPAGAGYPVTFTATVANITGAYSYTLTNNAGTTQTGTASGGSFSQNLTVSGSGSQNFTLSISDPNSGSANASVRLTIKGNGFSVSAQSGDWTTPGTWDCGNIPTAGSEVQIKAGHTVTIPSPVQANSLSLEGGNITFSPGGTLSVQN